MEQADPPTVGRYAEYFVKMTFVLLGYDVYAAEVDDRGIDFVLRCEPGHYWDLQVKSIREAGYVFMTKQKFFDPVEPACRVGYLQQRT
jgi:hypothetical protein